MVEQEGQTQPYGMSVHHMLDPPDDDDEDDNSSSEEDTRDAPRSSARLDVDYSDTSDISESTESEEDDNDDGYISSEFESDISDDEHTMSGDQTRINLDQGDKPGIKIRDPRIVPVTQPAFRDAWEQDLHADDAPLEELDEDHLTSYRFGKVYASSGLRRMTRNGMRHEIDWALIEVSRLLLPSYSSHILTLHPSSSSPQESNPTT